MKKLILAVLIIAFSLSGCTESSEAIRILEAQGYTKIKITGLAPLSCGKDDFYRTKFVAVKNNKIVKGAVCSGLLFKGSTIRVD